MRYLILILLMLSGALSAQTEDTRFKIFIRNLDGTGANATNVYIQHMSTSDTFNLSAVSGKVGEYRRDNVPFGKYQIYANGSLQTTSQFFATNRIYDFIVNLDPDGNHQIDTQGYEDNSITGAKIASSEVVKSINSLRDNVVLAAGSGVGIASNGSDTLTISSTGGGSGGGDITAVIPGAGLSGGGSAGDVSLYVGANDITGAMVADESLTADDIADDGISGAELQDNIVDNTKLAIDAVTNAKVADDAIDSTNIADRAVKGPEIADDAIISRHIADDAVTGAMIGDDQVSGTHIADGAVDAAQLAALSVTTAKLQSQSVTSAKIANGAVDAAQIANDAVGSNEISADAVGTSEISDGSITNADIGDNQVIKNIRVNATNITADSLVFANGSNATITTSNDTVYFNSTGGSGGGSPADNSTIQVVDDSLQIHTSYLDSLQRVFYGYKPIDSYLMFGFSSPQNLRISHSFDAINWKVVSETGFGDNDLRDPSPIQYQDGNFYICFTAGSIGSNGYFAIARSENLVNWVEHDTISVPWTDVQKTWSPRFFVDDNGDIYIIVGVRRVNSTDFRMYITQPLTADLTEWADFQMISGDFPQHWQDGTIIKKDSLYYLYYNDYSAAITGTIGYSTSLYIDHGYSYQGSISGFGTGYEGPEIVHISGDTLYHLYADDLITGGSDGLHYGISTNGMQSWSSATTISTDASGVDRNSRILRVRNAPLFPRMATGKFNAKRISTSALGGEEGAEYFKPGTVDTPDTLVKYINKEFRAFPQGLLNKANSIWDDDENTVVHFTFNNQIIETQGHTLTGIGPLDDFRDGPTGGTRSLYFDDASYIKITDPPALDFTGDFTVAAIIKPFRSGNHQIFWKRSGNDGYHLSLNTTNGRPEAFLGDGTNTKTAFGVLSDTLTWQMIHWVVDQTADSITIYTNSQFFARTSFSNVTGGMDNSGDFFLGSSGTTVYFKGLIAEVIAWDTLRSRQTIVDDYERMVYPQSLYQATPTYVFNEFFDGDSVVFQLLLEDTTKEERGHVLTVNGTPSYANGYFDNTTSKAMYFDGSTDYLELADTSTVDFDSSFTIAMVVKFDDAVGFSRAHQICVKRSGTDGYQIAINSGTDEFETFYGDGSSFALDTPGSYTLNVDQWYMLHVVYEDVFERMMVFVDGVFVGEKSYSSVSGTSANIAALSIGKFGGSSNNFKGWMDEIAIYKRALKSTEIALQYSRVQ